MPVLKNARHETFAQGLAKGLIAEQEWERRMTGYGRGWQEPKASGVRAMLRQIMREPATKKTWYVVSAIYLVLVAVLVAGGSEVMGR